MSQARVLLHGGPFDLQFTYIQTKNGVWPTEIRAALRAGNKVFEVDEMVDAYIYQQVDVTGDWPIFYASFRYVGMKPSAQTLINDWRAERSSHVEQEQEG